MKKFKGLISLFLSLILILTVNNIAVIATDEDQLPNVEEMTIRQFLELDTDIRNAIIDSYADELLPQSNINTRYKSDDENDPTHSDITAAALSMLIDDKGFWESGINGALIAISICVASMLPDKSEDESYEPGNRDHFYVPSTGRGLLLSNRSAKNAFTQYFNEAVSDYQNDDEDVLLDLGRALHYVQDVSVPHHTIGYLTIAHSAYEAYCADNVDSLLSELPGVTNSMYTSINNKSTNNIIIDMAEESNDYYDSVSSTLDRSEWNDTAETLMQKSAQISAAVIYKFAMQAGLTLYPV